jgi:hypothetical protein
MDEKPQRFYGEINRILIKTNDMKTSKGNNTQQSKQQRQSHKTRPEIRDDMDSRKNRESGFNRTISKKGDRKKSS